MPDDALKTGNLAEILNNLEGSSLPKKSRSSLFKAMFLNFDDGKSVPVNDAERILNICLKEENNLTYSVTLIQTVLNNEEALKSLSKTTLKNSALYIYRLLNTISHADAVLKNIKNLTLQTFFLHPKEIIADLIKEYPDGIITIFELDSNLIQMCELFKVLKIMPETDAVAFVECKLTYWFNVFIPKVMDYLITNHANEISVNVVMESFEILTEILIIVDYLETPPWRYFMDNVCNVMKYPAIVKKLLENRANIWHRLWIVLIKLLKNHITKSDSTHGTPINSLLPVVEAAFKMETKQRCRAFQCWRDLIDNFSKETNDSCLAKRFRLLIIPFKLNNAKSEEIALVKLETWWHFLIKFQMKIEKFSNDLLISLLHYMFGRHSSSKPVFVAEQLSNAMKKKCLQVFVEIVGHCNCKCQTDIPKANNKVLTVKLLVNNWNDWLYSLKTAIRLTAILNDDVSKSYMRCIWKSLVLCIAELPGNAVRKDLFSEMINLLSTGLDVLPHPSNIFTLIESLFENDEKIEELLKSRSKDYIPLYQIMSIITNPHLNSYYKRYNSEELINRLKPVASALLSEISRNTLNIDMYLCRLSSNDSSLKLWTAIMEMLCETDEEIGSDTLIELLKWPIKCDIECFNDVKHPAMVWYTIYNLMYNKLNTDFNKHVIEYVMGANIDNNQVRYFVICILIGILKHTLLNNESPGLLADVLQKLTSNITCYKDYDQVVPILVDTTVVMLNYVANNVNEHLATSAVTCTKHIIDLICSGVNGSLEDKNTIDTLLTLFRNLLQPINKLCTMNCYSNATKIIVEGLLNHKSTIDKESPLNGAITEVLKTFDTNDETLKNKIKAVLEPVKEKSDVISNEIRVFTAPDIKKVKKKKAEPNIVNKVVENGEEYVVVKSNWKFNPKKLTENQKEKFQRKREDIPALYQDLSQSQDEFRMTAWKADSQDTSSSKSASIDNVTALNKLPTNVVPNIMENILHDNNKDSPQTDKTEATNKNNKVETPVTPKNTKSPRMALKDRVFRNMKNLLEKSTPPKDKIENTKESQNLPENVPTTPKSKPKIDVNVVNSAPSLLADRPSRVKRKPRKFDDSELFALKRRRHSDSQTNSQSDSEPLLPTESNKKEEIAADKNNKGFDEQTNINAKDTEMPTGNLPVENASIETSLVPNLKTTDKAVEVSNKNSIDESNTKQDNINPVIEEKPIDSIDIDINKATDEDSSKPKEIIETKNNENVIDSNTEVSSNDKNEAPVTPIPKTKELKQPKSSIKKSGKKSRIEKTLAIDMVEGNPFLKMQTEKRTTRRKLTDSEKTNKRKSVAEKLNKSKADVTPKSTKKNKGGKLSPTAESISVTVNETQEKSNSQENNDDLCSEDFIESSQDSAVTTISVISTKRTPKKAVVAIEKLKFTDENRTQELLPESQVIEFSNKSSTHDSRDDIELPQNKTAEEIKNNTADLTENMDTQPVDTDDVIIINDDDIPITIQSESIVTIGTETQELAEVDTQPNPEKYMEFESQKNDTHDQTTENIPEEISKENIHESSNEIHNNSNSQDHVNKTGEIGSPLIDDKQRKQDFLNNTLEISPIKIQSPDRDKKSPSPETSNDYVVIQLSSPVQSNGEPYDKGSPEIFTEDKISPDKRDTSPPRTEASANSNSPSSLSLKKNRPQVRPNGRAAQMLGLCVPDKMQTINLERSETEEVKKTMSTPARRNLRILYNSVGDSETNDGDDSESFLKLKRSLPSLDSSPSVPILKRKHADITDDTTASPASKRKRVSFHDPPVSTTVSVQKYIEPIGLRSPSGQKRLERQAKLNAKSPKRLENEFKLVTVLANAVESFEEVQSLPTDDTPISLDVTPAIEIVKTSELNDKDPICPVLVNCSDPIDVIAPELSSPAMKDLLVKELNGKVNTVGDLAKMTELEVNRLCIKAPKVITAKKVLDDYARKVLKDQTADEIVIIDDVVETQCKMDVEIQTDRVLSSDIEVQTFNEPVSMNSTQTDDVCTKHTSIQTDESGSRSTTDIITTCITEREDFVATLTDHLEENSIKQIANKLTTPSLTELLLNKHDKSNSALLTKILEDQSSKDRKDLKNETELKFVRDYLCDRYESKDLILFCSQLLQKVYDKP